jgi:hypothetical protein
MAKSGDIAQLVGSRSGPARVDAWHLWTVIIPRRSISGRLVWGMATPQWTTLGLQKIRRIFE